MPSIPPRIVSGDTPATEWQKPYMTRIEICGLLLRIILYLGLVVAWTGYRMMDHQWPGALKLWVCSSLGALAMAWSFLRFFRQLRGFMPGQAARGWGGRHRFLFTGLRVAWALVPSRAERPLSLVHAIIIVIEVILGGWFLGWLIWGPPHTL
jgi:hypothetical protein